MDPDEHFWVELRMSRWEDQGMSEEGGSIGFLRVYASQAEAEANGNRSVEVQAGSEKEEPA